MFEGNYRPATGRAVDSKGKINIKGNFLNMSLPPIIIIRDLSNVHPWVKILSSARIISNLPLAGRFKHFMEAWEILTKDPKRSTDATHESRTRSFNTIGDTEHVEEESHIANRTSGWRVFKQYFLGREKRWGKHTFGELKIPKPVNCRSAFQNGRLFCLRELLREGYCMCKLDMKDAYFSVLLHQSSRKYVRFSWSKRNLYDFLYLYFGWGPAPIIFKKLLKIPMSILRRIIIQIVIYINNINIYIIYIYK